MRRTSSSSAITAPCAIAKACSRSTDFSRICWPTARLCRACYASAAGETAIELGDWIYEVHETPAGVDLYEEAISWTPFRTVAHAHSAGQALARLHLAARDFAAPPASRARWSPASLSSPHWIPSPPWRAISGLARRWLATRPFAPAPHKLSISSRPFMPNLRRSCPRSAPLDPQRPARLQSFLERSKSAARAPRPSSTLASPTAPTPCTILPTPSSATSWSGSLSSKTQNSPRLSTSTIWSASRWLRIHPPALTVRSRRARAHDGSLPCGVRAL